MACGEPQLWIGSEVPMTEQTTDRIRESAYKYYILEQATEVIAPHLYDGKDKYSAQALEILRGNAREKAKDILRAIAPFIMKWDDPAAKPALTIALEAREARLKALAIHEEDEEDDGHGDMAHPANAGISAKDRSAQVAKIAKRLPQRRKK